MLSFSHDATVQAHCLSFIANMAVIPDQQRSFVTLLPRISQAMGRFDGDVVVQSFALLCLLHLSRCPANHKALRNMLAKVHKAQHRFGADDAFIQSTRFHWQ
jgi:hypothetical protein